MPPKCTIPDAMKRCSDCGVEQSPENFNKGSCYCRPCHQRRARDYYARNGERARATVNAYRLANPELIRAKKAEYHTRNAERLRVKARAYGAAHRGQIRQYHKGYYARNGAAVREKVNAYRLANLDVIRTKKAAYLEAHGAQLSARRRARYYADIEHSRARRRAYYAAHPEPFKAHARKRQARLRGALVRELVSVDVLYERDGGICQICGKPCRRALASIDHIIPVVAGGDHSYQNTQLAHLRCNISRGAGRRPAQMRMIG